MKTIDLKEEILNASYCILHTQGVDAIRMRDLAKTCHCAVGTIYNVFSTFEEIHFHLNLRTFKQLMERLINVTNKAVSDRLSIQELLPLVGWEYIHFATEETNSWKALFEDAPIAEHPPWYMEEVDRYIERIETLLKKGFNLTQEKTTQLINYFWFAIHGVSSIVLNKKSINHSDELIDSYVDHCLQGIYQLVE